jgi:hypothetical protein
MTQSDLEPTETIYWDPARANDIINNLKNKRNVIAKKKKQ